MVAEHNRAIAPNGRAEVTIVQRIIDAQWRLLRNARLQTLEMEASLVEVRHADDHELLGKNAADMDMISANSGVIDTKYTKRLPQEEVTLLRIINMSSRELNQIRKFNPQPPPPVRRRIEYITGTPEPTTEKRDTNPLEVVEKTAQASHKPSDRSQPVSSDRSQPEPAFFPVFKRPSRPA